MPTIKLTHSQMNSAIRQYVSELGDGAYFTLATIVLNAAAGRKDLDAITLRQRAEKVLRPLVLDQTIKVRIQRTESSK